MVASLVVVEGVDGAGKNTLTTALVRALTDRGRSVGRLAFPRYGTLHADLAADALHGGQAGAAGSPHAMALLFALDRHAARGELSELLSVHDVVLLDRYVASNAAYTAARLGPDREAEAFGWIGDLEFGRLHMPVPDLQILLDTPIALAAERAGAREAGDPGRRRDRYERDAALQSATGHAYQRLATSGWRSPWRVLGPDPDVEQLAALVAAPGADPAPRRSDEGPAG